ncbi:hypothetical protein AB0L40_10490 [Patulibacter sp. NPDC049589]|uniref:hypothetical protein n=1 Tax=Patulibacter sp. NPDC049589 TaxID=3154731 RepID=UPI003438E2FE
MRRVAVVATILGLAVGAAGCGSDDDGSGGTQASGTSTATSDAVPTASTATATSSTATSDGGGADAGAYAETYEQQCTRLVDALTGYQERFSDVSGEDPDDLVAVYKSRTTALLADLRGTFVTMSKAQAPPEYEKFQRSIERAIPDIERRVAKATDVVASIRSREDTPNAGSDVKKALAGASSDGFPASLLVKAPTCAKIGGTG